MRDAKWVNANECNASQTQEYLLAEDLDKAQRDHENWFQIILFLTQTSLSPLSIICLQLGDGVLAVLISLTGIIAVMIGFAGNTDRHVKTSTIFQLEALETEPS